MTTTLYRMFDADGELLYVGITDRGPRRWREHMADKPWWPEVANVKLEPYSSRDDALDAELIAIKTEHTRHNIVHRELNPGTVIRLIYLCAVCHEPIDDKTGYIEVDDNHARKVNDQWDAFYEERRGTFIRGDELLRAADNEAVWQAVHAVCDPEPNKSTYWFSVEHARTAAQLLDWTAHLLTKSWIQYTDFDHFIRTLSQQLSEEKKG